MNCKLVIHVDLISTILLHLIYWHHFYHECMLNFLECFLANIKIVIWLVSFTHCIDFHILITFYILEVNPIIFNLFPCCWTCAFILNTVNNLKISYYFLFWLWYLSIKIHIAYLGKSYLSLFWKLCKGSVLIFPILQSYLYLWVLTMCLLQCL